MAVTDTIHTIQWFHLVLRKKAGTQVDQRCRLTECLKCPITNGRAVRSNRDAEALAFLHSFIKFLHVRPHLRHLVQESHRQLRRHSRPHQQDAGGPCCSPPVHAHYGRGKILRLSLAFPSAKNRALGKENLSRVLHSGKNCTRGREAFPSAAENLALGKEQHSAKALFPECNTRGRSALGKETCYLTVQPANVV